MKYDESTIQQFLNNNFRLWNDGNREAFMALYCEASSEGLVIEYVGQDDPGDGWTACEDMWNTYNQLIRAEPQEILVNGNEGACYVHNIQKLDGVIHPSIENYRFQDGNLHIRYFHHAMALADAN